MYVSTKITVFSAIFGILAAAPNFNSVLDKTEDNAYVNFMEQTFEEDWIESIGEQVSDADPCDPKKCKLPDCRCSGSDVPGGLKPEKIPQMVVLTFENAISDQNFNLYKKLFEGLNNPNKCPGVGTFFVSAEYTDYFEVQSLYSGYHEIGDNTVTFRRPQSFWKNATYKEWKDEMSSQKSILSKWANVSEDAIQGFRAPYLQLGGDRQLRAMKDSGLHYDASRSTKEFSKKTQLWPYTYDYKSTQDCVVGPCAQFPHKGMWQIPLPVFYDQSGRECPVPEACLGVKNEDDAYHLLFNAFMNHYATNRAPFTVAIGTTWLVDKDKHEGTVQFLKGINKLKDVYFVTASQALQWTQHPTTDVTSFKPWGCEDQRTVCAESDATTCSYNKDGKLVPPGGQGIVKHMRTCQKSCPSCYPWLNDPMGQSC